MSDVTKVCRRCFGHAVSIDDVLREAVDPTRPYVTSTTGCAHKPSYQWVGADKTECGLFVKDTWQ